MNTILKPITIEDAITGANELLFGGKKPNFKLAMWGAAMSSQQALDKNGLQSRILADYVHQPLPPREILVPLLKQANGNINGTHLNALYHIELLEASGTLATLENMGTTYQDHNDWRDRVRAVMAGHGMSWKTISMAALIWSPMTSQLVPIDRHVLKRLGYDFNSSPSAKKKYLEIENRIVTERTDNGYEDLTLALWHWYKWEEYRQLMGLSKADEGVESHKNLSCRWY